MINNSLKLAEYKLSEHKALGTKSKMSVFEVAKLMDSIKHASQIKDVQSKSIFHTVILN